MIGPLRTETGSADETLALAEAVGTLLRPGDVVVLAGDLGSGKTTFAKGVGRALAVDEPVVSPTFTIVRQYDGRLPLVHVDVYRLDHLQEVLDLGLAELLDDGGVTLIEWGDVVVPTLPRDFLEVHLEFTEVDDGARRITLRDVGPSWQPRLTKLTEAVSYWSDR